MPLGDLFYPDNPKRRARAEQLANDVKTLAVQFDQLKNTRDEKTITLKPKLAKLFEKHGLSTPEEIEKKIEANLSSEELQKYKDLKARLTLTDEIETVVMGIIDFFVAVTGVVLTIGIIAGIATAGAALVAVGEVVAIVALLAVIVTLIAGEKEREDLRHAIGDLYKKRTEIRIHVGQMQAVVHWISQLEICLETLDPSNPEFVDNLMKSTLAEEYHLWTPEHAEKALKDFDGTRESWTEEDHYQDINKTFQVIMAGVSTPGIFNSGILR